MSVQENATFMYSKRLQKERIWADQGEGCGNVSTLVQAWRRLGFISFMSQNPALKTRYGNKAPKMVECTVRGLLRDVVKLAIRLLKLASFVVASITKPIQTWWFSGGDVPKFLTPSSHDYCKYRHVNYKDMSCYHWKFDCFPVLAHHTSVTCL